MWQMDIPLLRFFQRADILAVLAHRSFRYLFLARTVSSAGDAIYSVALPWLVLEELNSPMSLGFTLSASVIPYIFMGPPAGVLADRIDRKFLMILSHAVQVAVLAVLIAAGRLVELHTLHFAVAAFLITAAGQLFYPARAAILPNLVPREDLVAGNAALTAGSRSIDIGGKAAAGFLILTIGALNTFGIILVANGLAALLLGRIAAPAQAKLQSTVGREVHLHTRLVGVARDAWTDFVASLVYILRHPLLRALALVGLVFNAFHLPAASILVPVFFRETLKAGPDSFGLFNSIESAAMFVALPMIPWLARRLGDGKVSLISLVALGVLIGGLAAVGQLWQAFAIAALMGLLTAGVLPMQSLVQAVSPDHMRGKVVANLAAANILLVIFTGPLIAWLTESITGRPLFLVTGIVVLLSGFALMTVREVREGRVSTTRQDG